MADDTVTDLAPVAEHRIPSPTEARIVSALDGVSLTGGEVARAVSVRKDAIYTYLNACVAKGLVTRIGLQYRSTVIGIALLKRYQQIEALKLAPLDLETGT